jgi:hypothetical protein
MNFRLLDYGVHHCLLRAMRGDWPQVFIIRDLMQNTRAVKSYAEAKRFLEAAALIAPCYFVVAGMGDDDGVFKICASNMFSSCGVLCRMCDPEEWRHHEHTGFIFPIDY